MKWTIGFSQWATQIRSFLAAQTEWEIETSRLILRRRKRFILLAMLPILAALCAQAADSAGILPEKIPILGGSKAYIPALINSHMFIGSIFVGLVAGLITGVIGAGGGYILTPALMSFGVRGIMAVGTDQFHLFAKAIMGTTIHRKLGNVNFALAAWFVSGSLAGVTLGGRLNRAVFLKSPALSDALISSVYVIVLGILGIIAIADWIRLRKADDSNSSTTATTAFAHKLQSLPWKPVIRFDEHIVPGGRSIPVYPVIICGFVVGFVAAIMGVGGGFLTFPIFVYGLGVSTFTTVGTDILQIIFTTSYSSIFQYAIYGFVFYTVAVGMLIGSLIGVQIGAMVTRMVKGAQIRVFFALTILAGFANRLFALPRKLGDLGYLSISRKVSVALETTGTVIFFTIVGIFALWIIATFLRGLPSLRNSLLQKKGLAPGIWIVNRAAFAKGVAGLIICSIVFVVTVFPFSNGRILLRADNMFNRFAKHSADRVKDARIKAADFKTDKVDIGIKPRDYVKNNTLISMLQENGLESSLTDDNRIRIRGDLALLCKAALDDAEKAFQNDFHAVGAQHNTDGYEVMYAWWIIFDGLTRRYLQENEADQANLTKFISSRVLEPAYNFRGIDSAPISNHIPDVALLLFAYVFFTIWYGFSILYVFEGLGITAQSEEKKLEA